MKQPQPSKWNSIDYRQYKKIVAQTWVRSSPNITGNTRPHTTWKWKLLKEMVIPMERISEESGDADDIDTASIGDIGESTDVLSSPSIPSPAHTRSYGKVAKPKKDREPFYKDFGVVYLPGDTDGLEEIAFISRRVLCK